MNALDRELRDRGLQVLGINLDEDPEDAKRFLEKYPAEFSVAFDANGRCPQDFGVQLCRPLTWSIARAPFAMYTWAFGAESPRSSGAG